jgi:GNAT superfamily N-acetyltransferase
MTIILRPVRRPDAPRLAVLLGRPRDTAAVEERLGRWLAHPACFLLGAAEGAGELEDDGELVGVVAWQVLPSFERAGDTARLLSLLVAQRHREGVGRQLVAAVHDEAHRAGCTQIEVVTSRRRDQAYQFYRSLGYEDTSGTRASLTRPLG